MSVSAHVKFSYGMMKEPANQGISTEFQFFPAPNNFHESSVLRDVSGATVKTIRVKKAQSPHPNDDG